MNLCEFCKKDFSNNSSLKRHINSSKKCISIRNNKIINLECNFCDKKLSSKQRLNSHLKSCKNNDKNIQKMKVEIDNLKKVINELERTTTTTNNITITDNSINNYGSILNYMTPEVVQETFKNFSIEDLLHNDRQRNLADITINKFLSGKDHPFYVCKDRSRNKFVYTDGENKEKEDPNATVLRTLVYNGVSPLLKKLYGEQYVVLTNELARCLRNDDTATILCSRDDIKELEEAYKQINILKNGDEYISRLGKCLPSSLKERIFKDSLELERKSQQSDEEFEAYLKKQTRMISNYTIAELGKWKDFFTQTGVIKGPKEIMCDPISKQEYIDFLHEKEM
jgi:hypothetical protein